MSKKELPVEDTEIKNEEELVAMLGPKPDKVPTAPTTHGVEEAYETSR